jgi:hydrogenase nickel incorporation protein HypA/HybF
MHEAGIVNNIIDMVKESIPPENISRLETIEIELGKMSNVLPEALEFCFHTYIEHSTFQNIRLKIKELNLNIYCKDCNNLFETPDFIFNCPKCISSNLEIIGGDELIISKLYLKSEGELI